MKAHGKKHQPRNTGGKDASLDHVRTGFLQSLVKGRAGRAQAPEPVTVTTSPYLLRLSLKRLEVVGDILQLLLQLRTLTVNVLHTAGEERGRRRE